MQHKIVIFSLFSSIEPLELPTDVTWEYLYQAKDKFKVTDPSSPNNLAYYKGKILCTRLHIVKFIILFSSYFVCIIKVHFG